MKKRRDQEEGKKGSQDTKKQIPCKYIAEFVLVSALLALVLFE